MAAVKDPSPLNWQVPIVDNKGLPTPEFMRAWQAMRRILAASPASGTAGDDGLNGFGMDGADGEDGLPGIPGSPGSAGITGAAGPAGPPGIDGADGDDGVGLLGLPSTWVGNIIDLVHGGTNADLSGTGGTSKVLKQISAGAAITVGQLASTDLSDFVTKTAWTPADGSGASLTFASVTAYYMKIGKLVIASAEFTYPATANGANAQVGGLPFAPETSVESSCYSGTLSGVIALIPSGTTYFNFLNAQGSNYATNVQLSGQTIRFHAFYFTT